MTFEEFSTKASEIISVVVDVCKTAWQQPHAPEIFAGALAALALLIIIRKIKKAFRPIKLFDNRAGVVEVSRKALDELVQSVCYSLGALNRPDVKITSRRGRLSMKVSLKLESGQSLTDATSEIQTAVRKRKRRFAGESTRCRLQRRADSQRT